MLKNGSVRSSAGQGAIVEAPVHAGVLRSGVLVAASWGLVISLTQIAVAVLLAGGQFPREGYYHLFEADSGWYQNIVEDGYFSPPVLTKENRGNVAFFPGYPLLVRGVKAGLATDTKTAALLASQVAAWLFWTYLLLFFQRWQVPKRLQVLGVLLVATHPGAFFLVAAYSESLFLAATAGFLYWTSSAGRGAFVLAAAHGLVMTATRLVGVPLVIFPLILVCLGVKPSGGARFQRASPTGTLEKCPTGWTGLRPWLRALSVGAIGSLGAVLFFAYCAWRFGDWNLYGKTEQIGWGVRPDYLGLFSIRIFHVHWPWLREPLIDPEFISRLTVPVTVLLFVIAALAEWRLARRDLDSGWRFRLGLYACAFLLLYVPVAAHCTRNMSSMTRFALCVQAILALAAVHHLSRWRLDARGSRRLAWAFGVWCALCFALQLMLTWRFVHGMWVA
jgi:hypothetical protein